MMFAAIVVIAVSIALPISHLLHFQFSGTLPAHVFEVTVLTAAIAASPVGFFCAMSVRSLAASKHRLRTTKKALTERISELDAVQRELREARDMLEIRVRERTIDLEEARLGAEKANRTKSIFLANMSHELRTPLNAIIGYSQLIRDRQALFGEVPEQRIDEYGSAIHRSGIHLLSMVTDLLDLSKIECGRSDLVPENLSVDAMIAEAVECLHGKAVEKAQRIEVHSSASSGKAFADRRALHQILINLLSNALKYSQKAAVIRIEARDEGEETVFVISDTGAGMTPEESRRAIMPFERLSNAHIAANESTGLGLSIVEGLVRMHGGRLDIASEKGVGTSVSVRLPRSKLRQMQARPKMRAAS